MKITLLLALLLSAPEPHVCDDVKIEPLSYAKASEKAVRENKYLVVFVCQPIKDVPGAISVREDDYGKLCGWGLTPGREYVMICELKDGQHYAYHCMSGDWTAKEIAERVPGNHRPVGNWRLRAVPTFSPPTYPLRLWSDSPASGTVCSPRG